MFWVGTGWKMNKTAAEARAWIAEVRRFVAPPADFALFFVAPATALAAAREAIGPSGLLLGAQNVHWEDAGAWTGEISARMLKEFAVDLVEIGHSERRAHFAETDATVNAKVLATLRHGMRPLVCVGDSAAERAAGAAAEAVVRQLKLAFATLDAEALGRCLVAYEPVWAIGESGVPAEPEEIAPVHAALHRALAERTPHPVPVLYGGSVSRQNAGRLAATPGVDGLFIGRAAWDGAGFAALVETACAARASA
jgi:triosephosphate isomerase